MKSGSVLPGKTEDRLSVFNPLLRKYPAVTPVKGAPPGTYSGIPNAFTSG